MSETAYEDASEAAFDASPDEINQPGLSPLREAVRNHLRKRLPGRRTLRRDGIAGLNSAVSSVPDRMASGILVGVNPIYGLYACMVAPIAGGILSSTQLNGRLYLTGLRKQAYEQVIRTGKFRPSGAVRIYEASSVRGHSTHQAYTDAELWLTGKSAEDASANGGADDRPSENPSAEEEGATTQQD